MTSLNESEIQEWNDGRTNTFNELSKRITALCKNKKIILMIDEVDKASNYEIFLYFLGMLRKKYHERKNRMSATFHSVILAGVYDIKNIKLKQVKAGIITLNPDEGGETSPWNIAADFEVDMSLNSAEIATMLTEYENEHNTGMDITAIAEEIHSYTSGYPFLVSRICKHIDEELYTNGVRERDWTANGVQAAVKILLNEKNTLFDDLFKNLENNKKLYDYVYDLLILGEFKPYMIYDRL